jgi:hypothetical protein
MSNEITRLLLVKSAEKKLRRKLDQSTIYQRIMVYARHNVPLCRVLPLPAQSVEGCDVVTDKRLTSWTNKAIQWGECAKDLGKSRRIKLLKLQGKGLDVLQKSFRP